MLGAALSLAASAQQINPITQAMLDGYDQLLKENPKDYFTYYERASQYYRLSRYDLALNDIKKSIEYTPAKEKSQLASEYSLCADIYTQLKEYDNALTAVDKALQLSPNNYPLLYMKGNICLYLNDLPSAKSAFQAMMRVQSRSQEALIGLAKVAIMEGNNSQATTYIEQAEKLDPANYLTYCRVGDLHRDMKMDKQAAADYISAFCLNTSSERPMSAMLSLSHSNYEAAIEAVDYALSQTSNSIPLNFLRGNIALSNGRYADAYESYRQLTDNKENDTSRLSPTMAQICLGLGNLQEADSYANEALRLADNEQANLLKARIEESVGNYPSALIYADKALRINNQSVPAAIESAILQMASGDYQSAYRQLSDALLVNPSERELLLLRAYLLKNYLDNAAQAASDYSRAATGDATESIEIAYKAAAQNLAGRSLDAQTTISSLIERAQADTESALAAAIYFMNIGDPANAAKYKELAGNLGYEDAYVLSLSINPVSALKAVK